MRCWRVALQRVLAGHPGKDLRHDLALLREGALATKADDTLGIRNRHRPRQLSERRLALGRQRGAGRRAEQQHLRKLVHAVGLGLLGLILLEHAVVVGAAEAEGGDAGAARHARRREPRPHARVDKERSVLDVGAVLELGRLLDVDRARDRLVLERQDHLDHPRAAGHRLQVADLALDRADRHALALRVGIARGTLAEHVLERRELDRVAHRRAGAVALHHRNRRRVDARQLVRAAERLLLPLDGGGVDAGRLAVGRGRAAADHRVHLVAVGDRVLELLQNEHHAALADEHAIGALVVCGDALLVREDRRLGEGHVHADRAVGARGARDHRAAVAVQKLVDGDLDGDERRGARCVDDAVHAI
mmetsp:Transcript_16355/g.38986  ORF Transcript_16355/g.38986 Transcript_16355/m.38986 type:complete len:362 (-) Transcript_16355:789-1874(-)